MATNKLMITKSDGQVVPFSEKKVKRSIARTGADQKTIDEVTRKVKRALKPKMHTREIYKLVATELGDRKPWAAARYNLREAIIKLGPAGYNFEKYVAAVLDAYGYKALTPDTYQGACIKHEIDVTAEKDGRTSFIEAKFRHNFRASINIKDTLATWARFLDLVDGSRVGLCPHFDECWIVTNARFTDQSLKFGHCKNMMMIGWNHPKERPFAQMVDLDALYPITIMKELLDSEITKFAQADLMLCRDISSMNVEDLRTKTRIPIKRLDEILELCESVIKGDDA